MIELGINDYVENQAYHDDRDFISSSGLKKILRDERTFYKEYILGEREPMMNQSALDTGSYIHALLLEPETVSRDFAVWEGGRKFGAAFNEFKDEHSDKTILSKTDIALGIKIGQYMRRAPDLKHFIDDIEAELTVGAMFGDLKVKVRADALKARECGKIFDIIDVKTTSSALNASAIEKTVEQYDYDLSAALYLDAFKTVKENIGSFYFYFIRKKPVDILIYRCSDDLIENGRRKYKRAIEKYEKNLKSNEWADNSIQELHLNERYTWI